MSDVNIGWRKVDLLSEDETRVERRMCHVIRTGEGQLLAQPIGETWLEEIDERQIHQPVS